MFLDLALVLKIQAPKVGALEGSKVHNSSIKVEECVL